MAKKTKKSEVVESVVPVTAEDMADTLAGEVPAESVDPSEVATATTEPVVIETPAEPIRESRASADRRKFGVPR